MTTLTFPDIKVIRLHFKPAIVTFLIATSFLVFLIFDRRPPFEYVSTTVTPSMVSPGQDITVNRSVIWHRKCEGEAWTEIVSSDRIVTPYDKGYRYPADTGITSAQRVISLPLMMRSGTAYYRGTIRFHNCGLTSRLKPIEIPYQERSFEVR